MEREQLRRKARSGKALRVGLTKPGAGSTGLKPAIVTKGQAVGCPSILSHTIMETCIAQLILFGFFIASTVQGQPVHQTSRSLTLRRYVMDVRLIGQKSVQSGVLFDLTDTSVVLAQIQGLKPAITTLIEQHNGTLPPSDSLQTILSLRTYRYDKISRLTLHRRGHAAKGFLIGAGVGILAGLIKGGDEPAIIYFPTSVYVFTFGLLFSAAGLVIGVATTKSVNAREQSVATEVPARFRTFTIVDQVNQSSFHTP
jgi:hypothetical protein